MKDVKNNIWNRRVPSFIGIFFLVLSIGTIGWLSSNAVLFGTKAAVGDTPKNVRITNVSDTSFTVTYESDEKTLGIIQYGENQNPTTVAFDDRDQKSGKPTAYAVHSVTAKSLKPAKKYFFIIVSDGKNYSNNNLPYELTTLNDSNHLSEEFILKGKVALDNREIPTEALIYVSNENFPLLSTLTDSEGKYEINLSPFSGLNENTVLNLQATDSKNQSNVSLLAGQINPVPLIILSKNYNFLLSNEPIKETMTATASGAITPAGFPVSKENNTEIKPQIINPENNQKLNDQQPVFKGTAVPGEDVEIIIESENSIKTTVKASAGGNWQYRPDTKLASGNHTITIRTVDASGIRRTITQSFVVFAAGSEFTEPSVSPESPTAYPTIQPTQSPTLAPTKTPTPTVQTNPTTTAAINTPTPQVPIPVTGNSTIIVTVIGIISAVALGALLFFLTAV